MALNKCFIIIIIIINRENTNIAKGQVGGMRKIGRLKKSCVGEVRELMDMGLVECIRVDGYGPGGVHQSLWVWAWWSASELMGMGLVECIRVVEDISSMTKRERMGLVECIRVVEDISSITKG